MMATVGVAAWLATLAAPVRPANPLGYVCYRAATAPKIDGRLDETAWRDAAWTADFVDIEGPARPRPRPPFIATGR